MVMKVAFFSAQDYDREYFNRAIQSKPIEVEYFESALSAQTAKLAEGCDAICAFVNDEVNGEAAVLEDDVFARLLTFPNVLITGHQAFFTHEALTEIAETTIDSILDNAAGLPLPNQVNRLETVKG